MHKVQDYIVVLQVGAVKLYAATVEALKKKKERQGETEFTRKTKVFFFFLGRFLFD